MAGESPVYVENIILELFARPERGTRARTACICVERFGKGSKSRWTLGTNHLKWIPLMATKQKQKSKQKTLSTEEIQQNYSKLQNELQALAQKIGELESEAEEHDLVLSTLSDVEPSRKCFRMIGGVLVERTVGDVAPTLQTNLEGIKKVIETLANQYKTKEEEFTSFVKEYNIRQTRA
ncbi:hypothetical protein FRB91_004614 [Serendipita sp. 411]|nr:hypothetical protein FRB91_004614 [Serendipita sp. 411]